MGLTKTAWGGLLFAIVATAAATGAGFAIEAITLPVGNISVAYLTAVLVVAMKAGQRPAILASVASFFLLNFFFTEPRHTLAISDPHNILTVVFFLVVAVSVGRMAARLKSQIQETRESARRTSNLYDFSRKVTAAVTLGDVLLAAVHHVGDTIGGAAIVLLPERDGLFPAASHPPDSALEGDSPVAAAWCWSHAEAAGRGTKTLASGLWLFIPMQTARAPLGVLGVRMLEDADHPSPERMRLLEALADQAAVAIERATLVADIEAARLTTERERLRSALLSSLSHDLRTPLVSIMGAASSLITYDQALDGASRRDLTQTVLEEAERLNRFVQNLLDMTKLGTGALQPRVDWADLRDIVGAAAERARRLAGDHAIRIEIDPRMPLLCVDAVLMEQAFFNLLDNACKYSLAQAPVKVWAARTAASIVIEVTDQGPGIPPEDREKVFDMFYRVGRADTRSGTGLGLAICRGVVEAHGGTIRAAAGLHEVGAAIVITLPLPPEPGLTAAAVEGGAS